MKWEDIAISVLALGFIGNSLALVLQGRELNAMRAVVLETLHYHEPRGNGHV